MSGITNHHCTCMCHVTHDVPKISGVTSVFSPEISDSIGASLCGFLYSDAPRRVASSRVTYKYFIQHFIAIVNVFFCITHLIKLMHALHELLRQTGDLDLSLD